MHFCWVCFFVYFSQVFSYRAGESFIFPLKLLYFLLASNQANGKEEFKIGDEMLVKCSSFTGKGIPVMSSVNEE